MALNISEDNKKYLIVFIIIFFIVGNFVYSYVKYGKKGIGVALGNMMSSITWLLFLALIIAVLYLLFVWKKEVNATAEVFKALIHESKISKPYNVKWLYLQGDMEHKQVKIGRIVGVSSRQNFKVSEVATRNKYGQSVKEKVIQHYEPETIFYVKRCKDDLLSIILSYIRKGIIVRCPKKYHDSLHKTVFIKCNSLVMHGLYFYPDVIHLDFDSIDHTIYYEGERFIQLKSIGLIDAIINKAWGIKHEDVERIKPEAGITVVKKELTNK